MRTSGLRNIFFPFSKVGPLRNFSSDKIFRSVLCEKVSRAEPPAP